MSLLISLHYTMKQCLFNTILKIYLSIRIRSLVISLKLCILKQIDFFFRSDDDVASATDEPQFYKEEKKNRIKMEIARRRQQIEENACLHDELTRCHH